jgi:hypothetical protein
VDDKSLYSAILRVKDVHERVCSGLSKELRSEWFMSRRKRLDVADAAR